MNGVEEKKKESKMRTLSQERASAAWKAVSAVQQDSKIDDNDYGQLARSAPADIQSNGLAQTLAFWKAKGKEHHKALFKDVSAWLKERIGFKDQDVLIWVIESAGTTEYRQATSEAIAYLTWIKRFAEAELIKD